MNVSSRMTTEASQVTLSLGTLDEVVACWMHSEVPDDFHVRLVELNNKMDQVLAAAKQIDPVQKIELVVKNKAGTAISTAHLEVDKSDWWVGGPFFEALVGPGYYAYPVDLNTACAKTGLCWELAKSETELLTERVSEGTAGVVKDVGTDSVPKASSKKRGRVSSSTPKTTKGAVPTVKSAPGKPTVPAVRRMESEPSLTPAQQAYAELLTSVPDGVRRTLPSKDRKYTLAVEKDQKGKVVGQSVVIKATGQLADVAPDEIEWNTKFL